MAEGAVKGNIVEWAVRGGHSWMGAWYNSHGNRSPLWAWLRNKSLLWAWLRTWGPPWARCGNNSHPGQTREPLPSLGLTRDMRPSLGQMREPQPSLGLTLDLRSTALSWLWSGARAISILLLFWAEIKEIAAVILGLGSESIGWRDSGVAGRHDGGIAGGQNRGVGSDLYGGAAGGLDRGNSRQAWLWGGCFFFADDWDGAQNWRQEKGCGLKRGPDWLAGGVGHLGPQISTVQSPSMSLGGKWEVRGSWNHWLGMWGVPAWGEQERQGVFHRVQRRASSHSKTAWEIPPHTFPMADLPAADTTAGPQAYAYLVGPVFCHVAAVLEWGARGEKTELHIYNL